MAKAIQPLRGLRADPLFRGVSRAPSRSKDFHPVRVIGGRG